MQQVEQSSPSEKTAPSVFREGKLLAIPQGAEMPKRCIYCNAEPDGEPRVQRVTHVPGGGARSAIMLGGIAGGAIGGAIAGAIAGSGESKGQTQTWTFSVYLCKSHRNQRKRFAIIVLVLLAVTVAISYFVGQRNDASAAMGIIFLGLIAIAVVAAVMQKNIQYKRHLHATIFLKGAGKKFLDSVPGAKPGS